MENENTVRIDNLGHKCLKLSKIVENSFAMKYNIEKERHNVLGLSIWRCYGNKKRHILAEANKSYA